MKRLTKLTLLFAAASLVVISAFVSADNEVTTPDATQVHEFVDADGDGICDNHIGAGWARGSGRGNGENFVDEDGDGICDNINTGSGLRRGFGRGMGIGCESGLRANFVDADGDGACDNFLANSGLEKKAARFKTRGRAGK